MPRAPQTGNWQGKLTEADHGNSGGERAFDLVDDLPERIPVARPELDVIETYLRAFIGAFVADDGQQTGEKRPSGQAKVSS